jgi:hypothetical protein
MDICVVCSIVKTVEKSWTIKRRRKKYGNVQRENKEKEFKKNKAIKISRGSRFSAPAQTVSGTHLVSCIGYRVSFPGVNPYRRPPTSSSAEVEEIVELYLH